MFSAMSWKRRAFFSPPFLISFLFNSWQKPPGLCNVRKFRVHFYREFFENLKENVLYETAWLSEELLTLSMIQNITWYGRRSIGNGLREKISGIRRGRYLEDPFFVALSLLNHIKKVIRNSVFIFVLLSNQLSTTIKINSFWKTDLTKFTVERGYTSGHLRQSLWKECTSSCALRERSRIRMPEPVQRGLTLKLRFPYWGRNGGALPLKSSAGGLLWGTRKNSFPRLNIQIVDSPISPNAKSSQ